LPILKKNTILLVEDDINLLNSNRLLLESEGYHVLTAGTLAAARKHMKKTRPDAVVLDIVLPDGNGLAFLEELRRATDTPVMLLTALGTDADVMRGLEKGGDDYLPKPIADGVFLTRIKAIMRRASSVPETLTKGALKLNILSGQAFLDEEDMMLAQKEFNLLSLFVQHENKTLATGYLYEKAWGQPMKCDANAVKVMVSRLRKKLEESDYTITAEYGEGYRFTKVTI
jgi:DNA-binding response OmpR family regulator